MIKISSGQIAATINPDGAELSTLEDAQGRGLLWDGDARFWTGRAPLLFPIVGGLNGGKFRHHGREYPLPKHGFARRSRFDVVSEQPDQAIVRLVDSDETRAVWPFGFRLDVAFAAGSATLTTVTTLLNTGHEPMPASFGYHPAFRWPLPYGALREDHVVRFEAQEPEPIRRVGTDGLMTPDSLPTPIQGDTLRLRDDLFADDAVILDRPRSRSLRYGAPGGPMLRIDYPDMPHLGLWTKPGAPFLCIEPWQGHADPAGFRGELAEKPGIVLLAPGEERRFTMRVTLEAA